MLLHSLRERRIATLPYGQDGLLVYTDRQVVGCYYSDGYGRSICYVGVQDDASWTARIGAEVSCQRENVMRCESEEHQHGRSSDATKHHVLTLATTSHGNLKYFCSDRLQRSAL